MQRTLFANQKNVPMLLGFAFAAVYLLWGSTYLALRVVLETMPPFLMASLRFLIAGSIMIAVAKLSHSTIPARKQTKNAALIGFFLLVVGNGGVVWAEQYIESGITALIITIEPVWVVLLLWFRNRTQRPSLMVAFGIVLGLIGMVVLVGPSVFTNAQDLHPMGVLILVCSSMSWAIGSVLAIRMDMPSSSAMGNGIQMLFASVCLFSISSIRMEWWGFDFTTISLRSLLGFLYLVVFGSLLGFTSYSYLLKNAKPEHVSTHAYVNPVVALFLGWWIGNELLESRTLIAAFLLIIAVVVIIANPKGRFKEEKRKEGS